MLTMPLNHIFGRSGDVRIGGQGKGFRCDPGMKAYGVAFSEQRRVHCFVKVAADAVVSAP